jgi:hypothetical protein
VTDIDHERVVELLGREPSGEFEIVVRTSDGKPLVIKNAPFLYDGTPMPTTYWLLGGALHEQISRIEAEGGVRQAEAAVDGGDLKKCHEAYERERDQLIDPTYEGPKPSGGVGGTRRGVKCLHAHYAHYLAGGDDPVGMWVQNQLNEVAE